MPRSLRESAQQLAEILSLRRCRVVFAESCTGGLVSATLAKIPGISEFHCGSAVVYRLDTKSRWLGLSADLLRNPGPVSKLAASEMASGVLAMTPEADWSAAITGHLGPNAPDGMDGLAFIGIACRDAQSSIIAVHQHWLGEPILEGTSAEDPLRERRQMHAAELVLQTLHDAIRQGT